MGTEAKTYHCPNCGGPLSFGIESQAWDCPFCRSEFKLEDLEATVAADVTEDYLAGEGFEEAGSDTFEGGARAFSCSSCGANIVTDDTTAATFCVFCRNPTIISARLQDAHRPKRLIPFKKTKNDATEAFRKLCKGKPFVPKAFRDKQHIDEMTGVYVPFWLFDASADAAIDAQGDVITTWSDRDYDYVKTDTFRIQRSGQIAFNGMPIDGAKKMDDALMGAIQPFQYDALTAFSMEYLSGHFAEDYDFDAGAAQPLADARMENGAVQSLLSTATGYSNLRVQSQRVDLKNKAHEYVMLPVWLLTTKYNEKLFTFAMNGQTGKITGELPFSAGRFCAWLGGLTAVFFALSLLVGYML